jgi:hypothetical protein
MKRATVQALSLLLLLVATSFSAHAGSQWVVPQGVTEPLQRDLKVTAASLGLHLQGTSIEKDAVQVTMGPSPQGTSSLKASLKRSDAGLQIAVFQGKPTLAKKLKAKLSSLDLTYLFVELKEAPVNAHRVKADRTPKAWDTATAQAKARLAGRLGDGPWVKESLPPSLTSMVDALRTGEEDNARKAAKALLDAGNAPPGTYSVYLAAGGEAPKDLRTALRRYPLEPRLQLLQALDYVQAGDRFLAAEALVYAMRLPLADDAVRRQASQLGLQVAESWPESLPGPPEDESTDLSLWWMGLFGLLALCMLGFALKGRQPGTVFCLLGGLAAAILIIPSPDGLETTVLPDALLAPLAGGVCGEAPAKIGPSGLTVEALCPEGRTTLIVSAATKEEWAFEATKHHHIHLEDTKVSEASPALRQAAALLRESLEGVEGGGFRAPAPRSMHTTTPDLSTAWSNLSANEQAELRVGAAVVTTALLLLLLMLLQSMPQALRTLRRQTKWVWLLIVLALLLYAFVPSRMLMVYSGYDRVDALASGELPRYGASSLFFYGPWLWTLGVDHHWIQFINRFLGLFCLVIAWDLGRVTFQMDRRTSLLSAGLLVTMPLLIRGFTSEAISPFPTLCLLVGLRVMAQTAPRNLAAAGILFICAAMGRPEIAAAVVFVPLWFFLSDPKRRREEAPWLLFGALIAAVALQVARTLIVTEDMASREALPLASNPLGAAFHVLTMKSAHASIDYTPLGFTPLFLLGVWNGGFRRAAFGILAVASVWLGATGIDLVRVSIPRLHLGPVLLMTPLVAMGAMWVVDRSKARSQAVFKGSLGFLVVCWGCGIVLNTVALFGPVTEEGEEALWRDTVAALPDTPGCLVRYGFDDPVASPKTPLYSPDYLLPEGWRVAALSKLDQTRATCKGTTFVLLGTHCYTHLRPPESAAPEGLAERGLCAHIRQRADLKPILTRDVPNVGEPPGLLLFPRAKALPVGLYEVVP